MDILHCLRQCKMSMNYKKPFRLPSATVYRLSAAKRILHIAPVNTRGGTYTFCSEQDKKVSMSREQRGGDSTGTMDPGPEVGDSTRASSSGTVPELSKGER